MSEALALQTLEFGEGAVKLPLYGTLISQ